MMRLAVALWSVPLVLASHPTPSPAPTGAIKYQYGGKCLSIGTSEGARDPSWALVFSDCSNATTWAEGFSSKHGPWPQISTPVLKSTVKNACVSIDDGTGLCPLGTKVHAAQCEDEKTEEKPADRFIWDDSAKQIRSKLCPGICVDVDGDSVALNSCSKVKGWTRQGPKAPAPFTPKPLTPAATTGPYHMFWPLPEANGMPIASIDEDGYPEYYGSNNAEICPQDRRYDCAGGCKCQWPYISEMPLWHGGKINGKTPGTTAHSIKRSEILQRALVWVANGFGTDSKFKNTSHGIEGCSAGDSRKRCPQYFHGGACCSLPTMAWNVSSGNCLRNHKDSIRIDCQDLKPGDVVYEPAGAKAWPKNGFGGMNHIMIFRKWTDEAKKHMMVYEHNGKVRTTYKGLERLQCTKRQNILEDVKEDQAMRVIV